MKSTSGEVPGEAAVTDGKQRYVIVRRVELTPGLANDMNAWDDTEVIPEEKYENRSDAMVIENPYPDLPVSDAVEEPTQAYLLIRRVAVTGFQAKSYRDQPDVTLVPDYGTKAYEEDPEYRNVPDIAGAIVLAADGYVEAAACVLRDEQDREAAREHNGRRSPVFVDEQLHKLGDDELHVLALDLYSDGPVRLPDGVDEKDALERLTKWHPGAHVAERTKLDGVLIHR
jgi:hypothetical protein